MYRDLPYYEGIRPKHTVNINFTKITQTVNIPLENGPYQVIVFGSFNSMVSTAIYSSCELNMADQAWIPEV